MSDAKCEKHPCDRCDTATVFTCCAAECPDCIAWRPLSAWENYRPDDLTDDELAEYVMQSKGILVP